MPFVVFVATRRRSAVLGGVLQTFSTKQVENVFFIAVACSTVIDGLFGVGKSIHCKVFRRLPFVAIVATRRCVAVLGGVLQTFSTKQVENVFFIAVACSTVIEGLFGVGKSIHCKFFRRLPFVVIVATRRCVAVRGGVLQKFCDNRRALPVFLQRLCKFRQ